MFRMVELIPRSVKRIITKRSRTRGTTVSLLLALGVITIAWLFAEQQNRNVYQQSLRAKVLNEASLIRAKLEGNISGNIQLVRGLAATLQTEPDMGQERFSRLAELLLGNHSQITHIAAAPDLVVRMIHPLDGNERALGLDYNQNEPQRAAALRARDTGELVLAGPIDLVQGGRGLIGRFPVFTGEGPDRAFWGILSAVISIDRLYRDSGLLDPDLQIEVALFGRDATGVGGGLFFGSPAVLDDHPVLMDVVLPSGSWRVAAVPRNGWDVQPGNIWLLRALMFVAGLLLLAPILLTERIMRERSRNIVELRRREQQLQRLSRRLQLALDTSRIGVWEMTLGEHHEHWDDRMNELYGYPTDGSSRDVSFWERRVHPQDLPKAAAEFDQAVAEGGTYMSQYRIVLDDGTVRHMRAHGAIYHEPDQPARMVGVNWDVTVDVELNEELRRAKELTEARNGELVAAKERIEFNSLHDSLTGLPNRRFLDEAMAGHAERYFESDEIAALLQIDLDRFKQINDTLGHAAGDALLVHTANLLRASVRPGDFIARIGGDEFVILCLFDRSRASAAMPFVTDLAERIIAQMQRPMTYDGHECRVGVSVGIATDADAVADPKRLLVNADIALYRAKGRGRNRFQVFNEALQAEITTTKRIADEILSGLEKNEFIAHYQPQFSAETLDIVGVEALVRWRHPSKGLLPPSAFMSIAEELNVVASIDRLVLEQTIAQVERWRLQGIEVPQASVNVSARRLHDEELIRGLRALDIRPGSITFELVESIFLDEKDEIVSWNVDQVKELGIDIEIDDFGTGYASIVSLMKLKPKRLKIDRQLVLPIVSSQAQRQLVGSIIDIGKSLGIEVLAEGVETMEHARLLRQLGCDALQGYAFARPMSADNLAGFVRARRWREAS